MNALKRKILNLIEAQGPLTVAQYMAIALGDPEHGYYMRRDPLGRDFITAPEISQIFGELIGLFFVQAWEDRGRPDRFLLVELGPGRGTMMADMMRAAAKPRPQFVEAARITLVETSPTLRAVQEKTLRSPAVRWVECFEEIPNHAPLFLIANEFFDALPIRQFVKSERGWHERMIARYGENLCVKLTPDIVPLSVISAPVRDASPGSVIEVNPGATELVRRIAGRIVDSGGVALIIDYGHSPTAVGDTFQAVKNNAFVDPLAKPGEADLTAHVDFGALDAAACETGAHVLGPVSQGDFLAALGIQARADRLKGDNPERIVSVDLDVDRLTHPREMGALFKALAVLGGMDGALPPGFRMKHHPPLLKTDAVSSPRVAHGFFGRKGGVSTGLYDSLNCGPGSGDARASVIENRARAAAALSHDATLVTLYQVHSAQAVTVHEPWDIMQNPKADALATNQSGIALGILTADCAPILLADTHAHVIGAAHAGWGGALTGVTESVVAAMERLGAKRERISAAIGPCISHPSYEVGPEFKPRFIAADSANEQFFSPSKRAGHWQFDLPAYVAYRLRQSGVGVVETVPACTYVGEADFFSYRRTTHRKEADYGRQLSAIMLTD